MSEKTEKPTSYKLQKAKEKGQIGKSLEMNTNLFLLLMLGVVTVLWPRFFIELKWIVRQLLILSSTFDFSVGHISQLHHWLISQFIAHYLPFAMAAWLAIALIHIAQNGIIWTTKPLVPNFNRLNGIEGLKKLFSTKTLFDAAKNTIKLSAAFLFLYGKVTLDLTGFLNLSLTAITQHPFLMMNFLLKTLFQLVLLLSLFSLLDLFYTRWAHQKNQRMSKHELKEEHKQREGDPKIKAKIKHIQQQLRQKTASLKHIKTADVMITNPSHLAIALKYERDIMPAPQVVYKARDKMAQQAKALAQKHNVPIIEHKALARTLYHSIELNQSISQDLYPVAADIFRSIYQQRSKA